MSFEKIGLPIMFMIGVICIVLGPSLIIFSHINLESIERRLAYWPKSHSGKCQIGSILFPRKSHRPTYTAICGQMYAKVVEPPDLCNPLPYNWLAYVDGVCSEPNESHSEFKKQYRNEWLNKTVECNVDVDCEYFRLLGDFGPRFDKTSSLAMLYSGWVISGLAILLFSIILAHYGVAKWKQHQDEKE